VGTKVLPTTIKDGDMPNWKKVIVSGSNVSQLNNDGVYLRTTGDGILSSSAQIATQISGAFTATSASLSSRLDNITGTFAGTGSNSFKGVQTFSGSLLPETTEVFGLGSADYIWAELYVDGQSIYMRDVATNTFVTMSANNGILTFNNAGLNVPLGITSSKLILNSVVNAGTNTGKFLVLDSNGNVDFRTEAEVRSDIGAQGLSAGTVSSSAQIQAYDIFLEKLGDNVISSSAQLTTEFDTRYLNTTGDGVISASAQVNHDATTNFVANEHIDHTAVSISAGSGLSGGGTIAATRTLSLDTASAHFTDGVKKKLNTEGVISSSAQLTGTFDTRYLNTTGDGVISSSAQIATQISGAFTAPSGGFSTRLTTLEGAGGTTFSSSVSTRLTSVEGYTLDNVTDNGSSTTNGITVGGLTVNGDVSITGTASIGYLQSVSGTAKIIGDSYIILNNDTPAQRFAGIVVQDSGSTSTTASLEFDGLTNDWFYEYSDDGGVTTDHGVILFGPEYATKGSPVYPSANVIQKGTGDHHLTGSKITDDGSTVTIGAALNITTVNAAGVDTDKFLVLDSSNNVDYRTGAQVLSDINPGGLISSSAQVTISSTTGYTTFSSSIATSITNVSNIVNGGGGEFTSITLSPPPPQNNNYATVVSTASGSFVLNGTSNYVLDTFYTGSAVEYNYVARNGLKTGRMGTIKVISAFANYSNGEISFYETSTPDMDPADGSTNGLVFSFDSNGSGLYTGRFLVSNTTGVNLIVVFERKEWNIVY
jgi:hypothetical protein